MSAAINAWLRDQGFRAQSENRFGATTWTRKGVSVCVPRNCSEAQGEALRMQAERDISLLARKPKSARARETAAKNRAAQARRLRELEHQIALRNRELDGAREVLSASEANRIVAVIEKHEREHRAIVREMTEIPATNNHGGRVPARHRA